MFFRAPGLAPHYTRDTEEEPEDDSISAPFSFLPSFLETAAAMANQDGMVFFRMVLYFAAAASSSRRRSRAWLKMLQHHQYE